MPKLVYTPTGEEPIEYDADLNNLTLQSIWDMQKVTKMDGLEPIGEALSRFDAPALMALLWVLRKADEPALKFHELGQVRMSEIDFQEDPEDADAPKDQPSQTDSTENGDPSETSSTT